MTYPLTYPSTYGAAFPQSPLDLQCEINLGGTWTGITSSVYQRDDPTPVQVTRGRPDETPHSEVSQAAFQINNRSGNFTPLNPAGAYYGLISRNTPLRFSVPAPVSYLRMEDDTASYVSAPDSAGLSITGDTEIQVDLKLSTWIRQVLATKYDDTSANRSWFLELGDDGTVTLFWSADGTNLLSVTSALPLPVGRVAVKVTLAVATGTVTFWTAPTIAGSWTRLGPAASGTSGASTSVFDSTAAVAVGAGTTYSGTTPALNGSVYAFKLLSGIGGTVKASPDFTAQAAGVSSFADAQANTWTLHGTAAVTGRDYRFTGEMSSLPVSWDPSGNDVWTPVTAGGILRRLGQGAAPLYSTMKRAILNLSGTLTPAAYWPCEDLQGSTSIGPAIGGNLMTVTGTATFAADSSFACSDPIPTIGSSIWHGSVPAYTSNGSIIVRFLMDVTSGPANNTVIMKAVCSGTVSQFYMYYTTGGGLGLAGANTAGGSVFDTGPLAFAINSSPRWISMELQPSGGNVNYSLTTLVPGASTGLVFSGSYAGTVGKVTACHVNPNGASCSIGLGHITVQSAYQSLFGLYQPLNAWQGETAGARFYRLCSENDIAARIYGPPATTAAMGAQTTQSLSDLLGECEAADLGMIYEPRQVLALGYRTLASLYNQTAGASLDYSAAVLGGDETTLAPTYDDQYTRNDLTLTRSGGTTGTSGASYRATLDDGTAMSISPPPVGVGDYSSSLSVNVAADSQLPDVTNWQVHLGTVNEQRWPHVPVNMARAAVSSVQAAVQGCDIGDYITITNPPAQIPPGPVKQLVAGYSEVLGGYHWAITLNCIPESPYEIAVSDDTVYGRADTDGSALAASVTSTATSMTVSTANSASPLWTTSDVPFDVTVGGEQITVTAVSGSSSPQTFTVTRSVNGVVKAHPAGADVRLTVPPIVAL